MARHGVFVYVLFELCARTTKRAGIAEVHEPIFFIDQMTRKTTTSGISCGDDAHILVVRVLQKIETKDLLHQPPEYPDMATGSMKADLRSRKHAAHPSDKAIDSCKSRLARLPPVRWSTSKR